MQQIAVIKTNYWW